MGQIFTTVLIIVVAAVEDFGTIRGTAIAGRAAGGGLDRAGYLGGTTKRR